MDFTAASPASVDSDKAFMIEYQSTCINRQADGSFMARFPWKPNRPPLPTNGTLCERRTQVLACRLAVSPDLLNQYSTILYDQECFGFIEKVNSPPVVSRCHYIPHHVVKKDSPTTPIRVLYSETSLSGHLSSKATSL